MADLQFALLLIAFSVLPPVLFAIWIRNRETHQPEPWAAVGRAFLYGAVVGTVVAFLLNLLFDTAAFHYGLGDGVTAGLLTTVVAAPFIEEATKGSGLGLQQKQMHELEDGMVYGAAIGLGFAATENILYGFSSWADAGAGVAVQTLILRTISSTILHAGASALLGYGYGRAVLSNGVGAVQVIPFYLLAVLLHGTYNLLVNVGHTWALFSAIVMVWAVISFARRRIAELDAMPHDA